MTEIVPKLELLFAPGCEAIEGTVAMVNEVLRELKSDAIVNEVMVDTADKARELKFLGSPSIRFNGRDIEAGADQRQDYGLGWRLYIYEDGSSSKVVSRELLLKALQGGK